MRGATPKAHKELIQRIKAYLRLTREPPYVWSKRVMGDKSFLWKLEKIGRMPFRKTVSKIEADMKKTLAALQRAKNRQHRAKARINGVIRRGH